MSLCGPLSMCVCIFIYICSVENAPNESEQCNSYQSKECRSILRAGMYSTYAYANISFRITNKRVIILFISLCFVSVYVKSSLTESNFIFFVPRVTFRSSNGKLYTGGKLRH